jgi:hypothetical protein
MTAKPNPPTVEEVLDEYGIQPNRSGMINCPLHEDNTPSLKANESWWYCFSCNRSGDGVGLIAAFEGCSVVDVLARYASDTTSWKQRRDFGIAPHQLRAGVKQEYRQLLNEFFDEVHKRLAEEPEWILLAVVDHWGQEFDDVRDYYIYNEELTIYQREQQVQQLRERCNQWLEYTDV